MGSKPDANLLGPKSRPSWKPEFVSSSPFASSPLKRPFLLEQRQAPPSSQKAPRLLYSQQATAHRRPLPSADDTPTPTFPPKPRPPPLSGAFASSRPGPLQSATNTTRPPPPPSISADSTIPPSQLQSTTDRLAAQRAASQLDPRLLTRSQPQQQARPPTASQTQASIPALSQPQIAKPPVPRPQTTTYTVVPPAKTVPETPAGSTEKPREKPALKPILKYPNTTASLLNPTAARRRPGADLARLLGTAQSPAQSQDTPSRIPATTSYLKQDPKKLPRKPVPGQPVAATPAPDSSLLKQPLVSHGGKPLPASAVKRVSQVNPALGAVSTAIQKPKPSSVLLVRKPTSKGLELALELERLQPPKLPSSPSATPIKSRRLPPSFRVWPAPVMSTRIQLRKIAVETQNALPPILNGLGQDRINHASKSRKFTLDNLPRLDPNLCPHFPDKAKIKVINSDTLDAAISEIAALSNEDNSGHHAFPAVVSFANDSRPGGGWLNGAMAQEEAICYRSSLSLSLNNRHYPLSPNRYTAAALYSPYVLIIRETEQAGHKPLSFATIRADPKVVSVLSVAAIHSPEVMTIKYDHHEPGEPDQLVVFKKDSDRDITKQKMRLVLRMAAAYRHRRIVLGALGCGVFKNPPEDVANCWLEVLREKEFGGSGNWWKAVTFAVYEPSPVYEGNLDIFNRVLDGQEV